MASKFIQNYLPELFALGLSRPGPAMVTVNLTNRCNQKCIYCEIGTTPPSQENNMLTIDDLTWIIDQMSAKNMHKISLCGGEPFLYKGLLDVVYYARTKNIRCSITSNGMTAHLLTDKDLALLKACETEINISIDSFDPNIQALTRGTNAALPNALKSLQKLKDCGIPVTILTVISIHNFRNLFSFFTTAFEKGIKQVLFQPVIYYSNYPERPALKNKSQLNVPVENLDILMRELRQILHFERNHKINTNVYRIFLWISAYLKAAASNEKTMFFNDVLKKFYCREVYAIIDISYDGGIQPCGLTKATIFIKENKDDGLLALWEKATSLIKADLKHERFYDICNGCCHHFSRNMLASLMKHPFSNHETLFRLIPLMYNRVQSRLLKKLL